jgi:hypothetical protein
MKRSRTRRFRWWLAGLLVGRKDWQYTFRVWVESGWDLGRRGQKLPWQDSEEE